MKLSSYFYILIFLHFHAFVFLHFYIPTFLHFYNFISSCICIHTFTCVYRKIRIHNHVFVFNISINCTSTFLHDYIFTFLYDYIFPLSRLCIFILLHFYIFTYLHFNRLHFYIYICLCKNVNMLLYEDIGIFLHFHVKIQNI